MARDRLEFCHHKSRTPGVTRCWERQGSVFPRGGGESMAPKDILTSDFKTSRNVREYISAVLSHLVWSTWLQQL